MAKSKKTSKAKRPVTSTPARPARRALSPTSRATSATPPGLAPCIWFDKNGLEAAQFYVSVFPRSRITKVHRSPADNPSTKKGEVLLIEFKLDGRPFQALNGGSYFKPSEAISFVVDCKDQEELDRYYDALSAVPEAEQCGWVKDRFGVSWQLTPRVLMRHFASRDAAKAERVMKAMLDMKRLDVAAIEAAAREARTRRVSA